MSIEYPAAIQSLFDHLARTGEYQMESSTYDDQSFGNVSVVLAGPTLCVRITKDRGQWSIEMSASGAQRSWYDTYAIRKLLTNTIDDNMMSIDEQVQLIRDLWSELEQAFGSKFAEYTESKLHIIEKHRVKRLFFD